MRKVSVVGLIFCLVLVMSGVAYSRETTRKVVLTMGKVGEKGLVEQKHLELIVTYLASRLNDVGIERGEILPEYNNESVIKHLKEGGLDIVLEPPFSACLYKLKANATPILLAWRHGVKEDSSVIFVRKDSGIHRFEELKGKIIAFEDPGSTPEYFLPKCSMEAEGMDIVEVDSCDSPVPEGKAGYVFAGTELNISSWVYFGKADAGALDTTDWLNPEENPAAYREQCEIIYETQRVPRVVVMVRAGLGEELVLRIKEELLKMDKAEEGRRALKSFNIQKFYEPPGGLDAAFRPIEDLLIRASAKELH